MISKFYDTKKSVFFIFPIIFISSFFYLKTLLPTTSFGDIGELQAASCTLGIAHPPSYPVYVILGKLFTLLPFNSLAWRVNFMSAFFSISSLILFFLIVKTVYQSLIVAFLSSLILAFSQNFWYFSLVAEMYSLNVFFMLLFLYFIIVSLKTKLNSKVYYLFFFLLGLAQGNHRGITIITPIFIFFIFFKQTKLFLNLKGLLKMIFSFVLGLSIYLLIPLRSSQNPYLNYAQPTTWKNFKYLILAEQFRFLMFAVPIKKLFTERTIMFWKLLNQQFFALGIILAFIGFCWILYKKKFQLTFILISIFLINTLVWLAYNTNDIYRYLTPSFVIVALFIAGGINLFYSLINKIPLKLKKFKSFLALIISTLVLYFIVFLLKVNYKKVDQSQKYDAYRWGINYLNKLKANAVVISYWPYSAVMWYLQGCEKVRTDILIADDRVILDKGWQTAAKTAEYFSGKRPTYVIPLGNRLNEIRQKKFKVVKQNDVYEIIPFLKDETKKH